MAEKKKILVSVPTNLLMEIDGITSKEKINRNDLILQAVKFYLKERKRLELIEQMKEGYQAMAEINLAIAEEGIALDEEDYQKYEKRLAEREKK